MVKQNAISPNTQLNHDDKISNRIDGNYETIKLYQSPYDKDRTPLFWRLSPLQSRWVKFFPSTAT